MNCARWDLCGGYRVTSSPTAILGRTRSFRKQEFVNLLKDESRPKREVQHLGFNVWNPAKNGHSASDRRPTGGADEREAVVPADEKRVYIFYTRQCGGTRLGLIVRRKKVAETAGELLKNTNIS